MKEIPRNERWDVSPEGPGFRDDVGTRPPGFGSGHVRSTACAAESLQKPKLLGRNAHHGWQSWRLFVYWCHQGVWSWRSEHAWFLVTSCVSSSGRIYCLEMFLLPWSDVPLGWGELTPSSHTLWFGISHEAAQSRWLSCHVKDTLPSTSPLCFPSQLETPASPGRAGMEGQSGLEWTSLPSGWIIRDLSQLGPGWLYYRVIWSLLKGSCTETITLPPDLAWLPSLFD